jgi:sigma-B regulation protein RsbU (phosphoserine phosphatase)
MPTDPLPRIALVVEDDDDIRGLLVQLLGMEGFAVTEASTGLAGIELARTLSPELVTLDLNLPDLDGVEVCSELRRFSDAYIIMLTARVTETDKLTGLETGADDYISKPFSPRELRARIAALFRRPRRAPAAARTDEDELKRAEEVQRSLLPRAAVHLPGYDVGGAFQPCRNVGGDFYDWYPTGDRLNLTVADAMGKGMGAALVAATARATLRSCSGIESLGQAFASAGRILASDLEASGSFVTMFHARLDPLRHTLGYVDAGHGLALHVSADGTYRRLPGGGPPVGAWGGGGWSADEIAVSPGDRLAIVSDGLLDAFATLGEALDAAARVVAAADNAQDAADALVELGRAGAVEDDVTAVVVRRLPALRLEAAA